MEGNAIAVLQRGLVKQRPTQGGFLLSFPLDSQENKVLLYRCIRGNDFLASDLVGSEVEIRHVVAHWASRADEVTGETVEGLRVVLVGPDGTRIVTSSVPLYDSLQEIMAIFGLTAPFDPPLRAKIAQGKCAKSGYRYLYLDMV